MAVTKLVGSASTTRGYLELGVARDYGLHELQASFLFFCREFVARHVLRLAWVKPFTGIVAAATSPACFLRTSTRVCSAFAPSYSGEERLTDPSDVIFKITHVICADPTFPAVFHGGDHSGNRRGFAARWRSRPSKRLAGLSDFAIGFRLRVGGVTLT